VKRGVNWQEKFGIKNRTEIARHSLDSPPVAISRPILVRELPKGVVKYYDWRRLFGKLLLNEEEMLKNPEAVEQLLYFHCKGYRPCECDSGNVRDIALSYGISDKMPQTIPPGTEIRFFKGHHPEKGDNARYWTFELEYKELQKDLLNIPLYRILRDMGAVAPVWSGTDMTDLELALRVEDNPEHCIFQVFDRGRWEFCDNPLSSNTEAVVDAAQTH
jgi:hypothetical protein